MSRITFQKVGFVPLPDPGKASIFVRPDNELYLMQDDGVRKKLTGAYIPIPRPNLRIGLNNQRDAQGNNRHDRILVSFPNTEDRRFLDYDPQYWLFRYKRIKREDISNGSEFKTWVHPSHLNGANYPNSRWFSGGHSFQYYPLTPPATGTGGGQGTIGEGEPEPTPPPPSTPPTGPQTGFQIEGRETEWPFHTLMSDYWMILNFQPHLWYSRRVNLNVLDISQHVRTAPEEFTSNEIRVDPPYHALKPTGRSGKHNRSQLFRVAITIRNPDENASCPRLIGPMSDVFRLKPMTKDATTAVGMSFKLMLA